MTVPARIADGVVFKTVGDEIVLLDFERGIYYGLDQTGARIWRLLAERQTVSQIVDQLLNEYDVDRETLEADVIELVSDLHQRGLIHD